jgi:hypothetical protein
MNCNLKGVSDIINWALLTNAGPAGRARPAADSDRRGC